MLLLVPLPSNSFFATVADVNVNISAAASVLLLFTMS
jgi:hypothetical protein